MRPYDCSGCSAGRGISLMDGWRHGAPRTPVIPSKKPAGD